jgi:enoyl-CoA hydratase/carnithine racemase
MAHDAAYCLNGASAANGVAPFGAERMSEASLRLEREGPVATLVLARPERQNAIGTATWRALAGHCEALAADASVRAVVVRGEGGVFSAGADISEFERVFADRTTAHAYNELVQDALGRLERLPQPTIAQIAGNCIGGGCALAVACDLRFAAEGARLGITPARLGLGYALGDVRRLAALIGPARTKDLLFTARLIGAAEALRLGLVDRVADPESLGEEVAAYLRTLCALSASSQRRIKAMVRLVGEGRHNEDETSRSLRDDAVEHPDFAEGRSAFLEKRPPQFA